MIRLLQLRHSIGQTIVQKRKMRKKKIEEEGEEEEEGVLERKGRGQVKKLEELVALIILKLKQEMNILEQVTDWIFRFCQGR